MWYNLGKWEELKRLGDPLSSLKNWPTRFVLN